MCILSVLVFNHHTATTIIYITKAGLNELSQCVLRLEARQSRDLFSAAKTRQLIKSVKKPKKSSQGCFRISAELIISDVGDVVSCDLFGLGLLILFWQRCRCRPRSFTSAGWIKAKRLYRLCNFTSLVVNCSEQLRYGKKNTFFSSIYIFQT